MLAPTSGISLFGSASKKQVRTATDRNIMSEIQLKISDRDKIINLWLSLKIDFCLFVCLKCLLVSLFCPLFLLQLVPVKEIDGTTSQDIFTVLNFGKYFLIIIIKFC